MNHDRLQTAVESMDAIHRQDPRSWQTGSEQGQPYEFVYAAKVWQWVLDLCPEASEPVQLAARAMHIGRWRIPRDIYPEGLHGYLQWREDLKKHHAKLASDLLRPLGYSGNELDRIQDLLRKTDPDHPDGQLLEDALCLVFLEYQLPDFLAKHEEQKVIDILRKTWAKMSDQGRAAALGLDCPDSAATLIRKVLEPTPPPTNPVRPET